MVIFNQAVWNLIWQSPGMEDTLLNDETIKVFSCCGYHHRFCRNWTGSFQLSCKQMESLGSKRKEIWCFTSILQHQRITLTHLNVGTVLKTTQFFKPNFFPLADKTARISPYERSTHRRKSQMCNRLRNRPHSCRPWCPNSQHTLPRSCRFQWTQTHRGRRCAGNDLKKNYE